MKKKRLTLSQHLEVFVVGLFVLGLGGVIVGVCIFVLIAIYRWLLAIVDFPLTPIVMVGTPVIIYTVGKIVIWLSDKSEEREAKEKAREKQLRITSGITSKTRSGGYPDEFPFTNSPYDSDETNP